MTRGKINNIINSYRIKVGNSNIEAVDKPPMTFQQLLRARIWQTDR